MGKNEIVSYFKKGKLVQLTERSDGRCVYTGGSAPLLI